VSIQKPKPTVITTFGFDTYGIILARAVATKSRDPRMKQGAIVFDTDNNFVASGYNGLPSGIEYTQEKMIKPLKHKVMNHAEENCLNGVPTSESRDGTIFITWHPCSICARRIISAKIATVKVDKIISEKRMSVCNPEWLEDFEVAKQLLDERGVAVEMVEVDDSCKFLDLRSSSF
jgi:dCMP deaminase